MTIYQGHIDGNLIFKKGDDAKALTSIGGSVDVSDNATLQADALTSIGGYEIAPKDEAKTLLVEVAKHALADPANLEMSKWHNESKGCGTSHCIAGWAVHLHPKGYEIEKATQSTHVAGNVLLGIDASRLFFLSNDDARTALHKVLADAGEPVAGKA